MKFERTNGHEDIDQKYIPIVDIWKRVLNIDDIYSEDADFFELGGSSLRVLELIRLCAQK
ncbi:acyl carrier protein [Francisella sp. 19X1-34]|uniref:acyl carrier protein n=1 Tax=Francisella sp. 19X1-34 TaxID=3087177 RepID=UPI0034E5B648